MKRGIRSVRTGSAEDSGWEKQKGANEFQHAFHRDPNEPERKEHDPDDRIKEERGDRDGPAEEEHDEPEKELDHCRDRWLIGD